MRTHKWLSNSSKMLENIPLHNRASQMNLADGEHELSINCKNPRNLMECYD